jgi:hypothetical protein
MYTYPWERQETHTRFWWENVMVIAHMEHTGTDERILKLIFKE